MAKCEFNSPEWKKWPIYTVWLDSFMAYIENQCRFPENQNMSWDDIVRHELEMFTASWNFDPLIEGPRIFFENDELATLFFLKFS